jgi:pyruvate dehydrogenase E2 component (dihydrolipoamide acetyltransferase)
MADVTMPRLSDTMEEGTIASWLKKPGEQVNKGDVIAQIETDKATMDLTAFEAGTLQEILAPEGTTVPIGQPVARIGNGSAKAAPPPKDPSAAKDSSATKDASAAKDAAPTAEGTTATKDASATKGASAATDASAAKDAAPTADNAAATADNSKATADNAAPATEAPTPKPSSGPPVPLDGKTRASPMARHLAAEHGLDLASISGSGPQGRVIRADVEAALSGKAGGPRAQESADGASEGQRAQQSADGGSESNVEPAQKADDDERVNLSQMRRTIARRMAESTRTVPHFFLTITVDAAELVKLRQQITDETADAGIKISFNDLIVKAAALAIRKVPDVNVSFAEDSLIRHKRVHIGVAVATERGLIVPVVRDVDQKSLSQISRETRDLAERANSGKLQPADYTGGTFTISNLGMFGVEQFNAVINPPEAAILAVGAITREPAEHDGQIVVRERMKLTLSVDHRALDGAIGARYLQALKQLLEKPMLLLV